MRNQTFVPNVLFDTLLPRLNPAELKVLLIIIRQTLGYVARNKSGKQRKQRDWISIAQFTVKTGLSRMAVSNALTSLQQKNVINITDYHTNALYTSKERRTCPRIFYSLTARWWEKNTHPRVKSSLTQEKRGHYKNNSYKRLKK